MIWTIKKFDELNVHELYAILQLRNEVFVIEQNCVYSDTDNKDQPSWHLMCMNGNKLLAYSRILPPGIAYHHPSIGRVVTSPTIRNTGLGRELIVQAIEACEKLFGKLPITLGAQLYLKNFYSSLGFKPLGEVYLEDGIEHITMTRDATS